MTEIFSNTFLEVPYEHKDIAKSNRCFFNMTAKQWSISPSNENYDTMVQLFFFKIVYLKNHNGPLSQFSSMGPKKIGIAFFKKCGEIPTKHYKLIPVKISINYT